MLTLPVILTYSFCAAIVCKLMTEHFAWAFTEEHNIKQTARGYGDRRDMLKPTSDQWFGAGLVGFLVSLVWPLALLWMIRTPSIGAAARAKQAAKLEAADEAKKVAQKRIAELERELST